MTEPQIVLGKSRPASADASEGRGTHFSQSQRTLPGPSLRSREPQWAMNSTKSCTIHLGALSSVPLASPVLNQKSVMSCRLQESDIHTFFALAMPIAQLSDAGQATSTTKPSHKLHQDASRKACPST